MIVLIQVFIFIYGQFICLFFRCLLIHMAVVLKQVCTFGEINDMEDINRASENIKQTQLKTV